MAVKKKSDRAKKNVDAQTLLSWYVDEVLDKGEVPKSVYAFCKAHGVEEPDFYQYFGSFEAVRQAVWGSFFDNAMRLLQAESAFATYDPKNKLLSLYFTFFEVLAVNRSYILFSLKENGHGLKNLADLRQIRDQFREFVTGLIEKASPVSERMEKIKNPVYAEGAWVQFLLILRFWMGDNSPGFEKTDIVIEKSVNTVVDLFDTKPLENLFDLGKFLWSEARMR